MIEVGIYPRRKEFEPLLEMHKPQYANKFLPEWYKKQKIYKKYDTLNSDNVLEAKRCPAIVEELTRGIVIPAWSDIYIWKVDGKVNWQCEVGVTWSIKHWSWIEHQINEQTKGMGLNEINGYGVFKLITPYLFKTPPGYGLYFKDAFYHHRNDVRLLSGYVETDIWHETNLPFEFLTNIDKIDEFKLMIKAGDPLFVVEPYLKEQKVNLNVNDYDEEFTNLHIKKSVVMNSQSEDWSRYQKFYK